MITKYIITVEHTEEILNEDLMQTLLDCEKLVARNTFSSLSGWVDRVKGRTISNRLG